MRYRLRRNYPKQITGTSSRDDNKRIRNDLFSPAIKIIYKKNGIRDTFAKRIRFTFVTRPYRQATICSVWQSLGEGFWGADTQTLRSAATSCLNRLKIRRPQNCILKINIFRHIQVVFIKITHLKWQYVI